MGWDDEGSVNGEPAKTRSSGDRVEALYGGDGAPDGPGHGHLVSNDGINAAYLREPGEEPIVDDDPGHSTYTGYSSSSSDTREWVEAKMKQVRNQQRQARNRGRRRGY